MKSLKKTVVFLVFLGGSFGLDGQKKDFSYRSAGTLMYAVVGGKVKVLLGSSAPHRNQASDFGGLRDRADRHHPHWTAAREACEELMFIFDNDALFTQILTKYNRFWWRFNPFKAKSYCYTSLLAKLADSPSIFTNGYIMHFMPMAYQEDLPTRFLHRKSSYKGLLPHSWNETVMLAWVDLDEIFDAIDARNKSCPAKKSFPLIKIRDITLYEPFVKSLLNARLAGITLRLGQPSTKVKEVMCPLQITSSVCCGHTL